MVHLPLPYTVGRQSHDGSGPAAKRSYPPSITPNGANGSALSLGVTSLTAAGAASQPRASLDVRVESAIGSAAKARMLWREGFTPLEMENSRMDEREVRRQEVIFELVHTEADYVKDLRIMVDVLQRPMHELRLASAEQIDLVFGNISEILELHEEINTALMERQRMQYPVVWDISDVLLPFVPRLRIYARYICNQDNALRLVDELRQTSNNFDVFWKERQLRPECRKLPMESFLVLPFQRLLKYPLLLRTLLASTAEHMPQHASARTVAEQIDAWIKKIQDARTKLDSFACLDALSRTLPGVDWAPLLRGEHRLAHSGAVRVAHCGASGALTPDEQATMWLFDAFFVVARTAVQSLASPVRGVVSCVPTADSRLSLIMGPSRAVEVLELAQCKGSPAVFLHAVPMEQAGPRSSIVVRFASKSEYALWRAKLDVHVRRTLISQPLKDTADVLADAVARTSLADPGNVRSSRSSSGSGNSGGSAADLPTISVRDVYVHFPPPRQRGKLRRGWDFLCSKTEDFTGHGIKRQLRKYGGGGGKRRATDPPPSSAPSPRIISTPILVPSPSPSFVNLFAPTPAVISNQRRNTSTAPSAENLSRVGTPLNLRRNTSAVPEKPLSSLMFGKPPENIALTSYARYSCRNSTDSSSSAHRFNQSSDTVVLSPPLRQVSKLELVSATLAYSPEDDEDALMLSAGTTVAPGKTLSTLQPPLPPIQRSRKSMRPPVDFGIECEMSDSDTNSLGGALSPFTEPVTDSSRSTLSLGLQPPRRSHRARDPDSVQGHERSQTARPKPLPIIPHPAMRGSGIRGTAGQRKPAPVFEFGSAKLTYGSTPTLSSSPATSLVSHGSAASSGVKTLGGSPRDAALAGMPAFNADAWQGKAAPLKFSGQQSSLARGWQVVDVVDDPPPSANSTDSFCIVTHDPQPQLPPTLPTSTRQKSDRKSRLQESAAFTNRTIGSSSSYYESR
ncbi:hypothetical protein GGH94_005897 [Coemansia aciculifera]|uniref:DH domain-containing protein n=1 Tax=Coemansia aciculifera TaxID=417176 RepID=A0A9W8IF78_9FUNG|nr:hypothetical protein GGH94_005897 [Coemansia aciculifera]